MIAGKVFKMALKNGMDESLCRDLTDALDRTRSVALFQTASLVRDRVFGREIHCMATVGPILPCKLKPHCRYCSFWRMPVLDEDAVVDGVRIMEQRGMKRVLLVGGACTEGYDREMTDIVKAVKKRTTLDLELNIGASLSQETVRRLKDTGVAGITASLETVNRGVFMQAKPGDCFERRKRFLEICDREGFEVRSVVMAGCGESEEDRIHHLVYLRGIKNLRYLMISRFTPQPRSPWGGLPGCSSLDWARTIALARLILPHVHIVMGGGTRTEDLSLWYPAGGGNQVFGMGTMSGGSPMKHPSELAIPVNERVSVVDRLPVVGPLMEAFGCRISFEDRLPDETGERMRIRKGYLGN